MARYLVETNYHDDITCRHAVTSAGRRTPEVAIMAAFVTLDPTSRCLWILVSPSEQHVRRWAAETGLVMRGCTGIVVLELGVD